ncbi:hypothetical protein Ahy_B05g077163 [Arachis hypogaea]|uniref:Uncharacterized protein n=1 Tax=Arachis hypogaea TaxID=3818 RepID=A0A444Z4E2_ARAHY|nr:hypothetical protein Ahy_B05g077163 [Arachis hypogaea]
MPSLVANPTSSRSVFPNTPANSPSENGKDQTLKPGKVRSPAACLKGSKNFISPTISASCKIIESPRKKVLIERNGPVPDSVPSAEAKNNVRKVTFAEPLECGGLQSDHLDLEERKPDSIFDGVPDFEESLSSRSSLTSEEDLSDESETVHDISVPLVPNNDTDLSFEAEHDLNVPLVLEDDKIETEPSFETIKLSPTPPPASESIIISGSFSEDSQSEEASQKEAEEVSSDEAVMEEGKPNHQFSGGSSYMYEAYEASQLSDFARANFDQFTQNERRSETTDITPRINAIFAALWRCTYLLFVSFNFSRKGKIGSKRTRSVEQPLIGKELHANNFIANSEQKANFSREVISQEWTHRNGRA